MRDKRREMSNVKRPRIVIDHTRYDQQDIHHRQGDNAPRDHFQLCGTRLEQEPNEGDK